jgi:hypothetical protein
MIEKKKGFELLFMFDDIKFNQKLHNKFLIKQWVSVESLLPKLEEAFNKSQPISTKVALGRIIKEIKEQ